MPENSAQQHIVFVITKSIWGGAQKYVYDMATGLPQHRFKVTVIVGGNGLLAERLREQHISVISLPQLQSGSGFFATVGSLRNIGLVFRLAGIFKKLRPDVIHLNSSKIMGIGAVAGRMSRLLNGFPASIIATVHGWPFLENRPAWQRVIIKTLSIASAVLQDRIILISKADIRATPRWLLRKKAAYVPNGINAAPLLPRNEVRRFLEEHSTKPFSDRTLVIGTIAELTPNKGINYLIDATQLLRTSSTSLASQADVRICVIGSGEQERAFEEEIRRRGLGEQITLLGFVPDAHRYLAGFDAFALPSLKEGLSYAIMEAMAAGLPVIATSVGGTPDLIVSKQNGILIPPQQPEAIAEAVRYLLAHPNTARQLGSEAKNTIAVAFSMDAMIERTAQHYV